VFELGHGIKFEALTVVKTHWHEYGRAQNGVKLGRLRQACISAASVEKNWTFGSRQNSHAIMEEDWLQSLVPAVPTTLTWTMQTWPAGRLEKKT
jgi:hypothetical protein